MHWGLSSYSEKQACRSKQTLTLSSDRWHCLVQMLASLACDHSCVESFGLYLMETV